MNFANYFYETEEKNPPELNPEELDRGIEVEKEHKDLWEKLKLWADEQDLTLPLSEDELYKTIAEAHLREIPDYYTRLDKMESEAKQPVEEEVRNYGNMPVDQMTMASKQ